MSNQAIKLYLSRGNKVISVLTIPIGMPCICGRLETLGWK